MAEAHPRRMAYLVSRYPAVSHTFILREVEALRRLQQKINDDRPMRFLRQAMQERIDEARPMRGVIRREPDAPRAHPRPGPVRRDARIG